ncbi:MAG: hypothetical protein R3C68_06480 [Myxococcota bacterium]
MITRDELVLQETAQDIESARVDLVGRRDQLVSDLDERINALDQLARSLDAGSIEPKTAQSRVRQLLGERSPASTRRAGRTTIGLSAPQSHPLRSEPSKTTKSSTLISRILTELDGRIVAVLQGTRDREDRREVRVELGLLWHFRRGLGDYSDELPKDAVLRDSVNQFAEHCQGVLEDVALGGSKRLMRLLEFERTLVSELVALGGVGGPIREQLKQAAAVLESDANDLTAAKRHTLEIYENLRRELDRHFPPSTPTIIDDLLRP